MLFMIEVERYYKLIYIFINKCIVDKNNYEYYYIKYLKNENT